MKEFQCPYCDFETDAERGLKRHITVKHKEEKSKAVIPDIDNTMSLSEVAGNVEIPMEASQAITSTPVEEPPVASAGPVHHPEEIFVDAPTEPVELDLKALGVTSVPEGAILQLNGDFWFKNTAANAYEVLKCEDIVCEVTKRLIQDGHVYLQLIVSDSDAEWCCLENDVFEGKVKLLHLSKPTPVPADTTDIIVDPPEEIVEEPVEEVAPVTEIVETPVEEPVAASEPVEPVEDTAPVEEPGRASMVFAALCGQRVASRMHKKAATEEYALVDKETRPGIMEFLEENGQPSEEGKQDSLVIADGYKAHLVVNPGKITVKRDLKRMVEWCLQNGHFYALEAKLNLEVWDKLVESGSVPAEFLQEVQVPEKADDTTRLYVEKL